MNPDLYGFAIDATIPACRSLIWNQFLKPRYYDQGVSAYWLDETDGEGSNAPGDGRWNGCNTSWLHQPLGERLALHILRPHRQAWHRAPL